MKRVVLTRMIYPILLAAVASSNARAQNQHDQESLTPVGPCSTPGLVVLTCGGGATTAGGATGGTFTCGVSAPLVPYTVTELGVFGLEQANGRSAAGYFSQDLKLAVGSRSRLIQAHHETPFVSAGYTRLWDTGNAVNFGGGFVRSLPGRRAWQLEARDYLAFTAPQQQNIKLRVGYVFGGRD
jgi:hypothetical protein